MTASGLRRCLPMALVCWAALAVSTVPNQLAAQTVASPASPPNIVAFVSDDMGWGQPGFNGGTVVATPNMDRIASEGVKLTQFYVQPVGAATRASLFTGRYGWKTGLADNPDSSKDDGLLLDERTLAEALQGAGYATWLVGKWHLGHWGSEYLPLQRGFDHHYGFYNGYIRADALVRPWQSWHKNLDWHKILDWHRNERPVVEAGYSTFLLADEASQLIGRHDGSRPFFLFVGFNAPHDPFNAPQEYVRQIRNLSVLDGEVRRQRAMVKALDDAIGQVVDALDQRGVLDSTLVLFLNDNGGTEKAGGNAPWRGLKKAYLEGGIRVPAVMRWPEEIPAGSESNALLHVVDLFPTLAGLAGADTAAGLPLDGLDVWETIASGAENPRAEVVHSPAVIRVGDWKLLEEGGAFVTGPNSSPLQLYNIANDPYETTNLASSETAKVAELRGRLAGHRPFARGPQPGEDIPGLRSRSAAAPADRAVTFGEAENTRFGAAVREAMSQREAGNLGPTLERLEAAGGRVKLVYDEALDTGSVPPEDAFTVVVKPGYTAVEVTGVELGGTEVVLTLDERPALGETVGLTYEVPDSGAIRDLDRLDAVGVTWVAAPVSAASPEVDATLSALSLSGIDLGTFSAATTDYAVTVPHATTSTTVTATANQAGASVSISPGSEVALAKGANEITVTVTAQDGTVQRYTVTVTRAPFPVVSIAAVSSPVPEGAAAEFEVTLDAAAADALTVAVSVAESGSMLSRAPPVSATFAPGATSATLSAPTAADAVVEADSTVTATLSPGAGYLVGSASSASVTVADDDEATFTLSTVTRVLLEGQSTTLTLAISNGVTFAENQIVDLSVMGTAAGADYTLTPTSLALAAGTSTATAVLQAVADQEEEADETVTVTASHGGVAVGSLTVTLSAQTDAGTSPRPNIVVILSDDMGWGQPGFNGGTQVETPSMDRIANEGVKLTQFYVTPQCAATRASLLSGRHYWKTGFRDQQPTGNTTLGMLPDERTIAEALRDAGYATWMVGKWHLGQWDQEHLPLQRGFDHHYGFYSGTTGYYSHAVRDKLSWHRNGRPVVEVGYTTFLMAEESIQLIERHDGTRPFFLYLAFNAPHLPTGVPPEYRALYEHLRYPDQRGQVKAMDDAIGWVIDALERKDVLDDTLVLFFNDNGGLARAGWNRPYRGGKGEFLEGGIRVPAAMRWPGNIAAGSETDALLDVVDLFPTFAGLAGAEPEGRLPLDGVDAWQAIAGGAPSPRQELPHALKVMRAGDWKLIEEDGRFWNGDSSSLQLYNIREDPFESTNLASREGAKVAELRARLEYHRQFARPQAPALKIPASATVYGEQENAAYGAEVRRALRMLDDSGGSRRTGNTGPTLVRLEAAGSRVKLVYDEALDTGSVPPEDAFTVVVKPGYTGVEVAGVELRGTEVVLTLDESPTLGETVGLTYEVPDSGAIRDLDRLDAVGVTWVAAPVSAAFLGRDATLSALSLSGIDLGTFAPGTTDYAVTVPYATASTTVAATANHAGATVSISPGSEVSLAAGANEITVTVTAEDGTAVQTYTVTVTRAGPPAGTIAAASGSVAEGSAAAFTVTLREAAPQALSVTVNVTETGSMLSGAPPASVTIPPGATSATLSVPTAGDAVVEADSTVTATLAAGTGYTVGAASSASVTVSDDDEAAFTLSAATGVLRERESATLTLAIANSVTFAENQTVDLSATGTASAADYTLTPTALTLAAGAAEATAVLAARADQEEEADETVTVAASLGGAAIGSLTVTIESVSADATLSALSLSGIDIGTFAAATTSYTASVPHVTASTTVAATANHAGATVSISPGSEVSLAAGANEITVTVTAEDGTTVQVYAVTVTRAGSPAATIVAVSNSVTEGTAAAFTVTLREAAPQALSVTVNVTETGSMLSGAPPASVTVPKGATSATLSVPTAGDAVVEADSTVTATLAAGTGYTVGTAASASVTVTDDDEGAFRVSVEPQTIKEGESATLTVEISNGVTFAEDQTIALAVSGMASAADYSLSPTPLTLVPGSSSVTAAVTATRDAEEEADETLTVAASHGGVSIGSATVTIESVSADATLSALSLSGVDIGIFSAETTAYAASVAPSVQTTTVTATASHADASVAIVPGPELSLAEGDNTVTVTVTAQNGTTTRTYTVTVTRASLPVVSIAAVAGRVSEGERAEFRVSLSEPATESLRVGMRWERSDQSQSITQYANFPVGTSSKTPSFSKSDDKVVRQDLTVSVTLQDGEGYRVSEDARWAQVVLEDNDEAVFAVSVRPASVAEGESASVRVRTTNGVTFAEPQTIALGFAGSTATQGADYTVSAESLTLRAGSRGVTASLAALADSDREDDETVRVEAAHRGLVIGTATLTITGSESEPEAAGEGFSLAPENSSPSGIWSDGETAWVADLADARLYAYRREDGERQPHKDIATAAAPMGVWSDGQTMWVAGLGGGLRAHRLADGLRLPGLDLALEANAAPGGVWSDGQTLWVAEWLGDTLHAYRLASGRREPGREIKLARGNLMPTGLWSDGQTMWVADWRERMYAYRLSDGGREAGRDLIAGSGDTDPTGLWSADGTLLATGWEGGEVRARRLPALPLPPRRPGKGRAAFVPARVASVPAVSDPGLRAAIAAALGKAPGEAVSADELAGLESLAVRNEGIRDLSGLERATSLVELDLGFNPLDNLRLLVLLPALESLNLDGTAPDPHLLASLQGLKQLSLRNNGIEDLSALAALAGLEELDVGDNLVQDLSPLAGLTALKVLRADRNRVSELWPLASLAGLEALDLGANLVRDLRPLAGLRRLKALRLGGNGLSDVHPLAGLEGLRELVLADNAVEDLRALSNLAGLRRLDLRGNATGDLRPLAAMPALAWVHVGGSGIADLGPLHGLPGLVVAGRDDRKPPGDLDERTSRRGNQ